MHFDRNEVLFGRRRGHFQCGVAHAKADLEGAWCLPSKDLIEIAQPICQFQAEPRPALIQTSLLPFGHATGTHHKAFDGAHAPLALGRDWSVTHERTYR